MPMHSFAQLTQNSSGRRNPLHFRHVARLATRLVAIITVQPFLVGSLFGQRSNLLAARVQRRGVQSVTGAA